MKMQKFCHCLTLFFPFNFILYSFYPHLIQNSLVSNFILPISTTSSPCYYFITLITFISTFLKFSNLTSQLFHLMIQSNFSTLLPNDHIIRLSIAYIHSILPILLSKTAPIASYLVITHHKSLFLIINNQPTHQ